MGGVTVSRVSGFNYDYIETEGIGEGAVVGVVRSGDVIPYVTEVFKKGNVVIPCKCPSCKKKLRKTDKEIICDNEDCVQKKIYNTAHFFKTIGANFITDRTIEMMGISSVEEAYNLKVCDLAKRVGIGWKKAELLVNEIKKTLYIKPEKFLDALGMPMIGTRLSKTLCANFTIDELFAIKKPKLLGIGEVASKALVYNIRRYKSLYKFLLKKGLKFIKENGKMKTLKGVKFALTGAGPLKRKDYELMAEDKGAVVKSMSKDTDYLVTDDPTTGSAKLKAAEKFGTKIISYTQFEKMLR
jgi:DNA ligase (NAD+)